MTMLPEDILQRPFAAKEGLKSLNEFVRWEDIKSARIKHWYIEVKRKNSWFPMKVPLHVSDYPRFRQLVLQNAPVGNPFREVIEKNETIPKVHLSHLANFRIIILGVLRILTCLWLLYILFCFLKKQVS
ncbi:hypothetical protein QJS83_14295 [Bdellovibrio sp. 22V]|uniref:hypothetical protein n=1 Tax=Bdellovibrio TaxID=958 RepID=UPI002542D8D9|nr:hypothetical protein [Bdellovibrio sp. 22V]WII71636.1 hypothetical protein QJS83_14295 [Bdellovibrio sp. 22V]